MALLALSCIRVSTAFFSIQPSVAVTALSCASTMRASPPTIAMRLTDLGALRVTSRPGRWVISPSLPRLPKRGPVRHPAFEDRLEGGGIHRAGETERRRALAPPRRSLPGAPGRPSNSIRRVRNRPRPATARRSRRWTLPSPGRSGRDGFRGLVPVHKGQICARELRNKGRTNGLILESSPVLSWPQLSANILPAGACRGRVNLITI